MAHRVTGAPAPLPQNARRHAHVSAAHPGHTLGGARGSPPLPVPGSLPENAAETRDMTETHRYQLATEVQIFLCTQLYPGPSTSCNVPMLSACCHGGKDELSPSSA